MATDDRTPTHLANLIAVRIGPYLLAVVGTFLVLVGALVIESEARAITAMVLGGVLCIAAATVTRGEKIDATGSSVSVTMTPTAALDPGKVIVATPVESPTGPVEAGTPTLGDLMQTAVRAGWILGGVPHRSGHVALTKTNMPEWPGGLAGDSLTVYVPADRLDAPVPASVVETLTAAGLVLSGPSSVRALPSP